MAELKCTYCGGKAFLEGPSGGMSTNVLCANPECRHWFNWSPDINVLDDLKRVEPTADEKAKHQAALRVASDTAYLDRLAEGRKLFKENRPIGPAIGNNHTPAMNVPGEAIRRNPAYGGYAEPSVNIDRLVGYIEALADKVREQDKLLKLLLDDE